MQTTSHLLSLSIWVPILAGLLALATGGDRNAAMARAIALVGALLGFLVTIPLYTGFDPQSSAMQFVELVPWIVHFNVNYHLGVDGISVLFILLNSFITVLVVIAGWTVIENRIAQYFASFLFLSGIMNGVFAALDGVLFYVFFEATLIPMFIIIGVWGGPNRVYAALKFFLYTLMGSLLLLVAVLYLYTKSGGSFSILDWHRLPIALAAQKWLFFAFCSRSRSRCRCGRCIHGCRTRTWRRPPVVRWSSPRSCSSSGRTASCGSRCRSCPMRAANWPGS